jgi:hypothetical protein
MRTSQSAASDFPERDLELLSAYIDRQTTPAEQREIEQRLRDEPRLRAEYEALQATAQLYRELEPVQPPRSFQLDPAADGRPARNFFQGLALLQFGSGLAGLLLVLLVGFQFLGQPTATVFEEISSGLEDGGAAPDTAMAPMPTMAATAGAGAGASTERPRESAAAEAPAAAAEPLAEAAEAPLEPPAPAAVESDPAVGATDEEMTGDTAPANSAEYAAEAPQPQAADAAPEVEATTVVGESEMTAMETTEPTTSGRSGGGSGPNLWLLLVGVILLGLGAGSFVYSRYRRRV